MEPSHNSQLVYMLRYFVYTALNTAVWGALSIALEKMMSSALRRVVPYQGKTRGIDCGVTRRNAYYSYGRIPRSADHSVSSLYA